MTRKKITNTDGPYKVDKGITMERKRSISIRFPFDKMKIGDSFYIPKEDQDPMAVPASIYSAANSYNRAHGTKIKMAVRKDEKGTRVFRIQDKK
jgi:hypothetical protein